MFFGLRLADFENSDAVFHENQWNHFVVEHILAALECTTLGNIEIQTAMVIVTQPDKRELGDVCSAQTIFNWVPRDAGQLKALQDMQSRVVSFLLPCGLSFMVRLQDAAAICQRMATIAESNPQFAGVIWTMHRNGQYELVPIVEKS